MIILLIITDFAHDNLWLPLGENWFWSLLRLQGLKKMCIYSSYSSLLTLLLSGELNNVIFFSFCYRCSFLNTFFFLMHSIRGLNTWTSSLLRQIKIYALTGCSCKINSKSVSTYNSDSTTSLRRQPRSNGFFRGLAHHEAYLNSLTFLQLNSANTSVY